MITINRLTISENARLDIFSSRHQLSIARIQRQQNPKQNKPNQNSQTNQTSGEPITT
jgi:hypothetical protein